MRNIRSYTEYRFNYDPQETYENEEWDEEDWAEQDERDRAMEESLQKEYEERKKNECNND